MGSSTSRLARARPAAVVLGTGNQELAPVHVADVVAVLCAADDRRGASSGTLGLNGPDIVSADALADLVAGRRRVKVHLKPDAAARAARLFRRPIARAALAVLAGPCIAEPPDAAAEFGITPMPLRDGLAASLER